MNTKEVLLNSLIAVGCTIGLSAILVAYKTTKEQPATTEVVVEFVCEEGDDITEAWNGLTSAHLVPEGGNMWEITSTTGDIQYFVQRPGQRCYSNAYEVESVDAPSFEA